MLNTLQNTPVQFGRVAFSTPDYFNGQLDEAGIWNRKLTAGEIQQLYTSSLLGMVTGGNTVICRGQSATLSASGASGYSWSTGARWCMPAAAMGGKQT